jgi:hypothetical protein
LAERSESALWSQRFQRLACSASASSRPEIPFLRNKPNWTATIFRDWAMAAIPFEGHPRRRDQRDLSPFRLRIRSAVRQLSFPVSRPARGLVRLALRGIRKGRRHRFKGRLRRQVRIEGQRT